MKQYLVTEDELQQLDMNPDKLLARGYLEELPPNGKWLTREEVTTAYILAQGSEYPLSDMLDAIFGEKG